MQCRARSFGFGQFLADHFSFSRVTHALRGLIENLAFEHLVADWAVSIAPESNSTERYAACVANSAASNWKRSVRISGDLISSAISCFAVSDNPK
jgi:hypothetical protein